MKKNSRKVFFTVGSIILLFMICSVVSFGRRTHLSINLENLKELYVDYWGANGRLEREIPEEEWEELKNQLEELVLVPRDNLKGYWCCFYFKYADGTTKEISLSDEIVIESTRNLREGVSEVKNYRPKNFDGDAFRVFLQNP